MWHTFGALFVLWLLTRDGEKRQQAQAQQPVAMIEAETAASSEEPADPEPYDLTSVKGLGPKSAKVLHKYNIRTRAQLAATDVDYLKTILAKEGMPRVVDPSAWPTLARES